MCCYRQCVAGACICGRRTAGRRALRARPGAVVRRAEPRSWRGSCRRAGGASGGQHTGAPTDVDRYPAQRRPCGTRRPASDHPCQPCTHRHSRSTAWRSGSVVRRSVFPEASTADGTRFSGRVRLTDWLWTTRVAPARAATLKLFWNCCTTRVPVDGGPEIEPTPLLKLIYVGCVAQW